jgi:hypothetical protein
VTDTRAEKQPPSTPPIPDSSSESGRGLHLVAALSDDWGVTPRPAAPGKTVWAELHVPTGGHLRPRQVAPRLRRGGEGRDCRTKQSASVASRATLPRLRLLGSLLQPLPGLLPKPHWTETPPPVRPRSRPRRTPQPQPVEELLQREGRHAEGHGVARDPGRLDGEAR